MPRTLLTFAAACLCSTLLYLVVFVSTLHKPLTTGTVMALGARRSTYVAHHPGPKIIVIAGSNGLYSFRCETIAAVLDRPCVNLSIGVMAGLNYDLVRVAHVLGPGDVVVMPYEFEIYKMTRADVYGGLSSELMVQYDRPTLWSLPDDRIIAAVFSFDFRFALEALTETAFAAAGVKGYFTTDAFTPEGDYAKGDAGMARHYVASIGRQTMATPDADIMRVTSAAQEVLARFFVTAMQAHAIVIGTLPTTFNDRPHDPTAIAQIAAFYRGHGAYFLVLPNQHQYPRSCFLDSHYHLVETCQIEHSRQFAEMLGGFLAKPAAPR